MKNYFKNIPYRLIFLLLSCLGLVVFMMIGPCNVLEYNRFCRKIKNYQQNQDIASDWTTYKNIKYNYEFKYPDNVGVVNEENSEYAGAPSNPNEEMLLLADKEKTFYLEINEGVVYVIKKSLLSDQILSTFKFTEPQKQVNISSWKTYTNTQYGYKFQYPPNWSIMSTKSEFKDKPELSENVYAYPSDEEYPGGGIGFVVESNSLDIDELKARAEKTERITLNNTEWTVIYNNDDSDFEYPHSKTAYTMHSNRFYILTTTTDTLFNSTYGKYEDVLSTFRFTK